MKTMLTRVGRSAFFRTLAGSVLGTVVLVAGLIAATDPAGTKVPKFAVEVPAKADRLNPAQLLSRQIDLTNFIVDNGCSGTFISAEHGLILTNQHCVRSKITTKDGVETRKDIEVKQGIYRNHTLVGSRTFTTEIVAVDKDKDLALLRFKAGFAPHDEAAPLLPVGKRIVRGQRVYIVGNPAMHEASIVEGIVSSVTRNLTELGGWTKSNPRPMIQVSGGIYGGNSGGALYDEDGFLIGVPSMVRRDAKFLGWAIPIEVVRDHLTESCFGSVWNPQADDEACRIAAAKADLEQVIAKTGTSHGYGPKEPQPPLLKPRDELDGPPHAPR